MYTIFKIIYGVPLNTNWGEHTKWSQELQVAIANQNSGFLTYYSGAGPCIPAAFGIELGQFDDACHHVELFDLKFEATDQQRYDFQDYFHRLSPKLQKEVERLGKYENQLFVPRVFFLFTTS